MVGIIVTGHGHFPSGLLSAVELVAGKPEQVTGVDFEMGQSTEELRINMEEALQRTETEEVLIFADLVGGTPFNVSAGITTAHQERHISLVAGVNMAAMVEAVFSRSVVGLEELTRMVKKAGMDGVCDLESLSDEANDEENMDGGL